jgi:5-methyltetrahydropteroyltriglutamate--homocysteine methyltransferase
MQRSTEQILTTHTGSLPRPHHLAEMLAAHTRGEQVDDEKVDDAIRRSIDDVIRQQRECGLTVINDGEHSKLSFTGYRYDRLSGFAMVDAEKAGPTYNFSTMEAQDYPEFYSHWLGGRGTQPGASSEVLCCVAPVEWHGSAAVERDVVNVKAATAGAGAADVFMTAISPVTYAPPNLYYADEDEYLTALADAMSVEYRAIVDGGLILQIDAPDLGNTYRKRDITFEQLLAHMERCVEMINYATRDLPADRIRVHVCCGADEAPHHRDVALADVVHVLMKLRPQGMTIVAANGRHSHEWKVWRDVKLPEGKVIIPGVIDSTTNIIEHPDAVAERIEQYASVLGRENLIAGVDCGFDTVAEMGQVDPRIAWAKLRSLAEGAANASRSLW